MVSKHQIVASLATLATKLGRAPTLLEFVSTLGISRHAVLRFFPKWNDAIRAAKLCPNTLFAKLNDADLLNDWGEAVRRHQGLPSRRAYLLTGKYEPRTLEKRFGVWSLIPDAFRKFAKGKRVWADVVAMLPIAEHRSPARNKEPISPQVRADFPTPRKLKRGGFAKSGIVYGNPLNFSQLRHEPVNEQGVVLLFGMLAEKLGYIVETIQNAFPDCEAKRQIGPSRWQRVLIEFEFESKNFRNHGHNAAGCDLIVCWRHNWPDCPPHLEILELSSIVRAVPN